MTGVSRICPGFVRICLTMATYLLIQGAWTGGCCWRKVVPLLEAKGHTVLAPDLPGHGDDTRLRASLSKPTPSAFAAMLRSERIDLPRGSDKLLVDQPSHVKRSATMRGCGHASAPALDNWPPDPYTPPVIVFGFSI